MNKKDVKKLGADKPRGLSAFEMRQRLFVGMVSGQPAWIVDALGDDRKLHYRLTALMRAADAASNYALVNGLVY